MVFSHNRHCLQLSGEFGISFSYAEASRQIHQWLFRVHRELSGYNIRVECHIDWHDIGGLEPNPQPSALLQRLRKAMTGLIPSHARGMTVWTNSFWHTAQNERREAFRVRRITRINGIGLCPDVYVMPITHKTKAAINRAEK